MAIGARTSPELIVSGTVTGARRNEWQGEYRGERVTIDTAGGPLVVGYGKDVAGMVPPLGTYAAIVVSAYDGARGSSLSFERIVSGHELDAIASTLAPVKG